MWLGKVKRDIGEEILHLTAHDREMRRGVCCESCAYTLARNPLSVSSKIFFDTNSAKAPRS